MTIGVVRGRRSTLVWLSAALGGLLALLMLHPGQYPFDSAFQLWQARTANYWNVTPVSMPLLWSLLLRVFGSPASLLCLNLAMFWVGIALCFDALRGSSSLRALLALACGLGPLTLVQMGHLLSDAHLAAVLVLIGGLIADGIASGRRNRFAAAVSLLVYAGSIRHNALLATVPFAVLLTALVMRQTHGARALVLGTAAIVAATLAFSLALDRSFVVERKTTWPSIALWDLAAISLAADRLLLPDFTHGPGLTVAELRETGAFDPSSNTHLFARSRSGIGSGFGRAYSPEQLATLRASWLHAVTTYPRAYLQHRARTFLLLAGSRVGAFQGQAYFAGYARHADNPESAPIALAPRWHQQFHVLAADLRGTWLFSAWPALAMAALAVLLAWRRRRQQLSALGLACATSALLYAAGYFVLAPGAELRYLTWTLVIAALALVIVILDRRGSSGASLPVAAPQTRPQA